MYSHNHYALVFVVVSCLFLTYTNSKFRIINGVDWHIARSPYIVSVNYSSAAHCVGSLITSQRVVTAAHCVHHLDVNLFTIIAGVTDFRDSSVSGQSLLMEDAFYPCDFSPGTGDMDIAVIKTVGYFILSGGVDLIQLCPCPLNPDTEVRVSGWGWTTARNGNSSPRLQSTILKIISMDECNNRHSLHGTTLTDAMFCAASPGSDTSKGDSGSPGVVNERLCGVASRNLAVAA
ncbi:trypsin alpha-4-like [Eurosta solidaginis]|uniref:trypsin alpha-4-like n=1 Tax=Eurosta solidaginis TaxID=178769 RepID=UPI003530BDA2